MFQTVVVGVSLLFGLGLVAMSSVLVRYRRAGAVERQQLTRFGYATALVAL